MLKNKAIWGIAVLLLAISFSYFTGPVYAGKASCPIPSGATVNLDRTVRFDFDANGVSQINTLLEVCKKNDGFGVLQYQASNITSPHTSSKSFDQGVTYQWRMKNVSTGETSSVLEFTVQ